MSHAVRVLVARSTLALAIALVATAALAQDVSFNAMPGIDFSKYTTYRWIVIKDAQRADQITEAQIKQAIDAQLATKGLTKTEDDQADLYVGYQVAINSEKQWNAYAMGGPAWGWGPGYYGSYGGGMTTATSSTIRIGTLGLDLYDRAARELVWRGTASKTLDPKAKADKREKNLAKAAKKMLKNYPPPVKK